MNCVFQNEIANLYFCNQEEYERIKKDFTEVAYLLCAKNPFHKDIVGYDGNCPKDHPEYLYAYRPDNHILALNMVDANDKKYFSDKMISAGIDFIGNELNCGRNVVVVCNKAESRSPTMCLIYLISIGAFDKRISHNELVNKFKEVVPEWNPRNGILEYALDYFCKWRKG